jgi:hypothetical protein
VAGTNTTRLALYKPNAADDINVDTDLNGNLDSIDLNMNYRVCTSSTRPSSPYVGQSIYETDTGKILFRTNAGTWQEIFSDGNAMLLNNTSNASLSSTGHAFQIGPTSGVNLIADNDSILARNNGAASTLSLNATGGNVTIGATGSTVSIPGSLSVGGQYFPVLVYKTSNQDRSNTTTYASDDDLQVSLAANATYVVEAYVSFGASTTGGLKVIWSAPSGATGNRNVFGPGSSSSQASADNISMRSGVHGFTTDVVYGGVRNSTSNLSALQEVLNVKTTNAGTLAFQWAQNASSATATRIGGGSYLRVTRVA